MSAINLMLRPNIHNRTFDWIGDSFSPYIDDGHFLGHGLLGKHALRPNPGKNNPGAESVSIFELAVPGFTKGDISISLAHDVLTVSGKRENVLSEKDVYLRREFELRPFEFRLRLRKPLESENIRAECENGMLRIHFKEMKRTVETQPLMINIS